MDKIANVMMGIILLVVVALIFSLPVKWIWNDLITDLFTLRRISIGEALQLSLFCSILFKSSYTSKN